MSSTVSRLVWNWAYVVKVQQVINLRSSMCHADVELVRWLDLSHVAANGEGRSEAQVRSLSQSRPGVMAEGTQTSLPLQALFVLQVQLDRWAAEGNGGPGRVEETTGGRGCRRTPSGSLRQRHPARTPARTTLGSWHSLLTRKPRPLSRPKTQSRRIFVVFCR